MTQFNPNEIEMICEIGRGGTSVVHKFLHKPDNKFYAIKSVDKSVIGTVEFENLQREVGIMSTLNHPNILKMHYVFQSPQQYHLVLDYMEGGELFEQIKQRGCFLEKDAQDVLAQLLSGVKYLHENAIAHRDLKPENLLYSGDGQVVISDFGLSKFFGRGQLLMTRCGTPAYVAPEVVLGKAYTTAVDMWSIGVITYVLLSGIAPFFGSDEQMFEQIVNSKYDFPDEFFSHVSPSAIDFITALLQFDPSKRPTCDQCLQHPWIKEDLTGSDYDLRDSIDNFLRNSRRIDESV